MSPFERRQHLVTVSARIGDVHTRVVLDSGIDTDSDDLILHERFLAAAGLDPDGPGGRREESVDAFGDAFVRVFADVQGAVRLAAAPHVAQTSPPALFQCIRYDGLVGRSFLQPHAITWDLVRGELLVS